MGKKCEVLLRCQLWKHSHVSYIVFINTENKAKKCGKEPVTVSTSAPCQLGTLCGQSSMNTAGVAVAAVGSNGCSSVCTSVQKYHALFGVWISLVKATNYLVNEICLKPVFPSPSFCPHHFHEVLFYFSDINLFM